MDCGTSGALDLFVKFKVSKYLLSFNHLFVVTFMVALIVYV